MNQASNDTRIDRKFNPYRIPATKTGELITKLVIQNLETFERSHGLRKRKRKPLDQLNHAALVTAVTSEMIQSHLIKPDMNTWLQLSKQTLSCKSRYKPVWMGAKLSDVLKNLSHPDMAIVTMNIGGTDQITNDDGETSYKRRATTITPGQELIRLINLRGAELSDLSLVPESEVIELRDKKPTSGQKGALLEYVDTNQTLEWRKELKAINKHIANANLEILDCANTDLMDRQMTRIFNNGSFNQGGRMYGGFWQSLSKAQRRNDLLINGEHVVELDYGQMGIRLLYSKVDATPPEGDLYCIPDLRGCRQGCKELINAAISSNKQQERMPVGSRKHFPNDTTYKYAMTYIKQHHHAVSDWFYTGIGTELMFVDSEIMISVLLHCTKKGITALPIHDGILVPQSQTTTARTIMEKEFLNRTGLKAVVSAVGQTQPGTVIS